MPFLRLNVKLEDNAYFLNWMKGAISFHAKSIGDTITN